MWCVRRYAFAIPNCAALQVLARHAPLIELGAGTGYWTYLLRRRGVDCLAFDLAPPDRTANPHRFGAHTWTAVQQGGIESLSAHPQRALFLCWPPLQDPFADRALAAYPGSTLVYIGEEQGGRTADDAFFARLRTAWRAVDHAALPTWPGMRDALTVYRRSTAASNSF